MAKLDVDKLILEVERGLAGEASLRMELAQRALDYYNFQGRKHMEDARNDAETPLDYIRRKYRQGGITRQAVRILTQHMYSPGPGRQWDVPAGQAFLDRVYEDNHVDAKLLRADQLAMLGDACAIQIDAGEATFEDKPITLRLWGAEEFHVWEDPDNRTVPGAVCTKDKYDETARYRLWTADRVHTFVTSKATGTAGGRVARKVAEEDNTYGCLPFAFVHNEYPARCFWETGIGDLIVEAEVRSNDRLSRLDQSIHKHLNPFPWAKGVPPGFQVILGQPNMFITLPGKARIPGQGGDYQQPDSPEVGYLQAMIDVAGAWEDLRGFILQVFEAAGIPQSAVRMEQTGVASGIALIVEQAPLLTRARERRPYFGYYEADLARTILRCAGNHYRRGDLLAAAQSGTLTLDWPEFSIPIPTDDWYDLQMKRVATGTTSIIRVVEQERGCSRDQAISILEQVAQDQQDLEKIMPGLRLPGYSGQDTPDPDAAEEPDGDGDEGTSDTEPDE